MKDKLMIAITTTVVTAMKLCPKCQQKAADAILMIRDPFMSSHGPLADEMMVSPTAFCVTTCRNRSVKGTVRIRVLPMKPLQPAKMSDAI